MISCSSIIIRESIGIIYFITPRFITEHFFRAKQSDIRSIAGIDVTIKYYAQAGINKKRQALEAYENMVFGKE